MAFLVFMFVLVLVLVLVLMLLMFLVLVIVFCRFLFTLRSLFLRAVIATHER